jgi:Ser/Thr protein kinase RdoA (MazF antagonist)
MSTISQVEIVLRRFGVTAATAERLGNHGGFSGARLWRVETRRRSYCLKSWPAVMTAERHAWIASLMRHAREAGVRVVPVLAPAGSAFHVIGDDDRIWDLAEWMPGVADFRACPSQARLRAACQTLALLHRAWERVAEPPRRCPAIVRRLIAAGEWNDATVGPFMSPFRTGIPFAGPPDSAWELVKRHVVAVPRALEPWAYVPFAVQPCLCDVWHDHVLFTGDEVTGLIDYGSMKVDNVATDLARLLGSLVGDDETLFAAGLDAYAGVRPLTVEERAIVRVLDRTGTVLGLANWVRRCFQRGRPFDEQSPEAVRIAELVARVEKWSSVET